MKQDRLNSYMLVHCHKTVADTLDPLAIAKTFASANEQRKGHLGNSSKRRLVCLTQETTYVVGWIGTFNFFIHKLEPSVTLHTTHRQRTANKSAIENKLFGKTRYTE